MLVLALAQPFDWWTTYRVLSTGGHESNTLLLRLQAWLYGHGYEGRWVWLTLSKAVAAIACGLAALLVRHDVSMSTNIVIGVLAALQWAVIAHNYGQIRK